jgi:phage shock protein PspC (stress-responsive transcriptional regulator)
MNEVKKIHIGRQAFTIALDAYSDLKKYLDALERAIQDKDVLEEIELRMVELLSEQKITQEKVILKKDVTFLQETLGDPSDFTENDSSASSDTASDSQLPRRFMRDSRGQILGGVANGLASYFGVDPLWFRVGFIALTFASGFGILLYLILWAIMPEAKTSSDYIQMQGKPVTVESITEFAESKEVEAGIHRIGQFTADMFKLFLRVILYAVGIGLTTAGMLGILGSIFGTIFVIGYSDVLFGGVKVFPVGGIEVAAVVIGAISGVTASIFMLFSGMGIFAKKWQLPTWTTAGVLTLFFVSAFTAVPLAGSSVDAVSKRIDSAYTTSSRQVEQFSKIKIVAKENISVVFEPSDRYSVEVKTFGKKDTGLVVSEVMGEELTLRTEPFTKKYSCNFFCTYPALSQIVIKAPSMASVSLDGPVNFAVEEKLSQSALELTEKNGGEFLLNYIHPQKTTYWSDESRVLLEGLQDSAVQSDRISLHMSYMGSLYVMQTDSLVVSGPPANGCIASDPLVVVGVLPKQVTIGGAVVDVASIAAYGANDYDDFENANNSQRTLNNCIMVDDSAY